MYKHISIAIFLALLAGCASPASPPTNTSVPAVIKKNTATQIPASPTSHAPTKTPAPTPTQIAIEGLGKETASLFTGGMVNYPPTIGDGSLWIPVTDISKVLRVDLDTGALLAEIPAGSPVRPCCGANSVAFGGGFVWVAQGRDKAILKIDPLLNEVVDTIPVGVDVYDIVVDGNNLWVTAFEADSVLRINIESMQVVATVGEVLKPTGITVGGGAVWAVEHRKGNLVRIDPTTNTIATKIKLASVKGYVAGGQNVTFAFGSVWVATSNGQAVARIDPTTNEQTAILLPGLEPLRVTAGSKGIWVHYWDKARNVPLTFGWINPQTNEMTTYNLTDNWILFEHEGILWTFSLSPKGDWVHRIEIDLQG